MEDLCEVRDKVESLVGLLCLQNTALDIKEITRQDTRHGIER